MYLRKSILILCTQTVNPQVRCTQPWHLMEGLSVRSRYKLQCQWGDFWQCQNRFWLFSVSLFFLPTITNFQAFLEVILKLMPLVLAVYRGQWMSSLSLPIWGKLPLRQFWMFCWHSPLFYQLLASWTVCGGEAKEALPQTLLGAQDVLPPVTVSSHSP